MKKIILLFLFILNIVVFSNIISKENEPKIGLVLSGGGAKGFAHIGVIKVLEENNIPVDYIVGTSVGSIVGALYAIGYDYNELKKIAVDTDWDYYLSNGYDRKKMPIEEKIYEEKFIYSFDVENSKLKLPKGILNGQKVELLFNDFMWCAHDIKDFSKFPISFASVATDFETGEVKVFNSGNLYETVRASMSIPGVFTPYKIGDRIYVDGMMASNFPVDVAKDMGADIIIGVNVGGDLKNESEAESIVDILNQSLGYIGKNNTDYQKELVDILIEPDTRHYPNLDFNIADDIIEKGYEAALLKLEELKKYSNDIKYDKIRDKKLIRKERVFVRNIVIHGLEEKNHKSIIKILDITTPNVVHKDFIDNKIEKLIKSRFFGKVTYSIDNEILNINITKDKRNELRASFRYDTDDKSSVLFNLTLRDFSEKSNKATLELKLGNENYFEIKNHYYTGFDRKFGVINILNVSEQNNVYIYDNKGKKEMSYDLQEIKYTALLGYSFKNHNFFGIGYSHQFGNIEPLIKISDYKKENYHYGSLFFMGIHDSLDRKDFSKNGNYIDLNYVLKKISYNDDLDYSYMYFTGKKVKSITKRAVLNNEFDMGLNFGNKLLFIDKVSFGGLSEYKTNIKFYGLNNSQISSKNIMVYKLGTQYEYKKNRYFLGYINYGIYNEKFSKILSNENRVIGGAIGYGADTLMGPIELLLHKSSKNDLEFYFSIGYNF
ncbi:MAG: patatin-like phospholipase family protein [Fusobacteria bacterium]|nr:patatin-like phospholipase family protein [Fusobacteriota bacterium]